MIAATSTAIEADVLVIGAGLSGLAAARALEARGARVVVVEGADRVGGRLHTLDDLPGRPEAGGIQVGRNYARTIALARELGVGLEEARFDLSALYLVNGALSTGADWPASPGNRLAGPEREVPPPMLPMVYARRMAQLENPADWTDGGARLDMPYADALRGAGASDEAIRLIDANLNGNSVETLSALNVARSVAALRSGGTEFDVVTGGSQRLPEAMAASLREPVRLGQRVTAIVEGDHGVEAHIADGHSVVARHALCTIPFSVLRSIAIDADLPPALRTAIATLPYTRATFVYLQASEAFWRQDGLPAMIWSDDLSLGRVFALDGEPPLLKVWLAAHGADAADRLSDAELGARIVARLAEIRPASAGKLTPLRVFRWARQPLAQGMYHHIAPGMAGMLADALRSDGGRLHFAGEHLSLDATGMEAALESGKRVAEAIPL